MASVTDVTIGATSTSILAAADWDDYSGPVYLKNESDTIVVLTIAGSDDYDLDPGEIVQVIPGQIVTGTAVGGSKLLQIIAGIVPVDESAAKSAAGGATADGLAAMTSGRAIWSTGQGDFTAVYASSDTLTLGTFPTALSTPDDGNFALVVVTDSTGLQTAYVPTSNAMTLSGQDLTVDGAAFVTGGSADLDYDVFVWGPPRSYDASTNGDQVQQLNPEWSHVDTQQEVATGQTDGTANDYYIDMEYYNEVTFQIVDTPGLAGTNTYTIEATATNDGTAAASCDYDDIGASRFSAASWTTNAFEPCSVPFRAKYLHINVTRTDDGGNSDGAWTINILLGNS